MIYTGLLGTVNIIIKLLSVGEELLTLKTGKLISDTN